MNYFRHLSCAAFLLLSISHQAFAEENKVIEIRDNSQVILANDKTAYAFACLKPSEEAVEILKPLIEGKRAKIVRVEASPEAQTSENEPVLVNLYVKAQEIEVPVLSEKTQPKISNIWANEWLLQNGAAWFDPSRGKSCSKENKLIEAEAYAQEKFYGVWSYELEPGKAKPKDIAEKNDEEKS